MKKVFAVSMPIRIKNGFTRNRKFKMSFFLICMPMNAPDMAWANTLTHSGSTA